MDSSRNRSLKLAQIIIAVILLLLLLLARREFLEGSGPIIFSFGIVAIIICEALKSTGNWKAPSAAPAVEEADSEPQYDSITVYDNGHVILTPLVANLDTDDENFLCIETKGGAEHIVAFGSTCHVVAIGSYGGAKDLRDPFHVELWLDGKRLYQEMLFNVDTDFEYNKIKGKYKNGEDVFIMFGLKITAIMTSLP